jgi:hypothetical protein
MKGADHMTYPKTHPAVRLVREGRYTMIVPEVDLASIGGGNTLHVLHDSRAVCGRTGNVGTILEACDPRAEVVLRLPVCGNCRSIIGDVPGPKLAEEVEDGHSIGVTRTELDRERRAARRAA